jgi:D-aspartate ligase
MKAVVEGNAQTKTVERSDSSLPPVIILGGEANALSVARDLGRAGVKVYILCDAGAFVRHSRFVEWIETLGDCGQEAAWSRFLLSQESDHLKGAVVLSCSDAGIQVLLRHREQLESRFKLDIANPRAQRDMLDKFTTYEHAHAANVPTPGFWETSSREQIMAMRDSIRFPVMVKPRLSHLFEAHFGRKHVIVSNFDELLTTFDSASKAGLDVLLMEWIPGPDSLLCSYFTYLDENSNPLFAFTKRVVRRFPSGMGGACYHITDWVPEIVEQSNRLLKQAGLRGLANVEYKLDERDGQYKVIECNARFIASNGLVSKAGCKLALFVYNRIVGRPLPKMQDFKNGLRLWDPLRDWRAFLERRQLGEISFLGWLKSVMHAQQFAYFELTDPKPAIVRFFTPMKRAINKLLKPRIGQDCSEGPVAMEKGA